MDDQTILMADQAEKAIAQVRRSVRELLEGRMPTEKAEELAELLSIGTWTHDYPITLDEAQQLGLPVSSAMPEPVLRLMTLYPQPLGRQAGVEYLEEPRRLRPARSTPERPTRSP